MMTVSSGAGVVHGGADMSGLGALDTTSTLPGFSDLVGSTVDSGSDCIAAADWLDVTYAMLDTTEDLDPA